MQQAENEIHLSETNESDVIIARFEHALKIGTCPLCSGAWRLSRDQMRYHWFTAHPDEYQAYKQAKNAANLKMQFSSITAIKERLLTVLKEGPQTRDQLVKKLFPDGGEYTCYCHAYTQRGETTRPTRKQTCLKYRTTIYDGLRKLIARNEVKKYPLFATERSRGRPQVLFALFDGKR